MKFINVIVLLLLGFNLFSQEKSNESTSYFLINAGYQNSNGNYFKLGPEFYFVQNNQDIIDLKATANMAYFKDHFVVIPEVGLGYQFNGGKLDPYNDYIKATFYTVRVNASPWYVAPEIGVTLLGLLEANLGYSFEFKQHDFTNFDGFRLGLTFHLPTLLFSKPNF